MARYFRINWQAIVEEAKQRRKTQKLTQQRLALLAGVSTPTVSRFENGEKDLQVSTVISILNVLGMMDQRKLIFSKNKATFDPKRMVVIFTASDGNKMLKCVISQEALQDHFQARKNLLESFKAHRQLIEQAARCKYFEEKIEPDGTILLESEDFN